jgi:hypothetical protein
MNLLRLALILLFLIAPSVASAECVCRCFEGKMKPICSRLDETRPRCPDAVCPINVPVEIIQDPNKPLECVKRKTLNPFTNTVEMKTICN